MYSIRVTDSDMGFSSAHFVVTEEGFEALHGHNYTVEVTLDGNLDEYGMVVDFRQVKKEVSRVCKSIDHRVLLPGISPHMTIVEDGGSVVVNVKGRKYSFPVTDCMILPLKATTAEMLAKFIHDEVGFPTASKVTVCVTENVGTSGCYTRSK